MFEWLDEEIRTIRTGKFHRVDGPADAKLRRAIKSTKLAAPRSYKEFALRFGNANLYRNDSLDLYRVTVHASMHECSMEDGARLMRIGRNENHDAYFRADLLDGDRESPVFEWIEPAGYLRQAADGFEAWLNDRCRIARHKYSKRRWQEILRGPAPLTNAERAMLKARKKFRWRIVGVARNQDVRFEVHNGSDLRLEYLTIGIRGKTIGEGAIFLPVRSVAPGRTKVITFDCYKQWERPTEIEAFSITDLGPEDRPYYWEFSATAADSD
jgi:hypothetical protein